MDRLNELKREAEERRNDRTNRLSGSEPLMHSVCWEYACECHFTIEQAEAALDEALAMVEALAKVQTASQTVRDEAARVVATSDQFVSRLRDERDEARALADQLAEGHRPCLREEAGLFCISCDAYDKRGWK